jgi:hypothetical protein
MDGSDELVIARSNPRCPTVCCCLLRLSLGSQSAFAMTTPGGRCACIVARRAEAHPLGDNAGTDRLS